MKCRKTWCNFHIWVMCRAAMRHVWWKDRSKIIKGCWMRLIIVMRSANLGVVQSLIDLVLLDWGQLRSNAEISWKSMKISWREKEAERQRERAFVTMFFAQGYSQSHVDEVGRTAQESSDSGKVRRYCAFWREFRVTTALSRNSPHIWESNQVTLRQPLPALPCVPLPSCLWVCRTRSV